MLSGIDGAAGEAYRILGEVSRQNSRYSEAICVSRRSRESWAYVIRPDPEVIFRPAWSPDQETDNVARQRCTHGLVTGLESRIA